MANCRVSFVDSDEIEHFTEVEATSVYEAACRGWCQLSVQSWRVHGLLWDAKELKVKPTSQERTYAVESKKLLSWVNAEGLAPKEHERRREMFDIENALATLTPERRQELAKGPPKRDQH